MSRRAGPVTREVYSRYNRGLKDPCKLEAWCGLKLFVAPGLITAVSSGHVCAWIYLLITFNRDFIDDQNKCRH